MVHLVPPATVKLPRVITQLGRTRIDNYAWMKDDNWQKVLRDPSLIKADVKAHLTTENAYAKSLLASTEDLQANIFEEMKGRIKEDDASVPAPDGSWEYYTHYQTGAQHPRYCRQPREGGAETVLIDADAMAQGQAYFLVGAAQHSPDHSLYAYAADEQGSEVFRIYVKDLATGAVLPGPVESSTGDFCWSPDSRWLLWTHRDDNGRPDKIFRRPARGGPDNDVLVYQEADEAFFLSVHLTQSRAFIVIGAGNHETSEAWLIPAIDPTAAPRLAAAREPGVQYSLEHWNGRFMIRTNADAAIDFKIVEAPEEDPSRGNWRDWAPCATGRYVVATAARRDYFIQLIRENAANRLLITGLDGGEHGVAFDEEAFALSLSGGYEFEPPVIRFVYESPTTPKQWFDYDMAFRRRVLRKTQEIPSGHDPAAYVTRRLFAAAPDGAEVPITLVMQRGAKLDGSAPLLLYGYGSYGISIDASFSIRNLSLVDRGWIWATAHVRGGSEKGWGWFLDGRKDKKTNTFIDFIACAEHLHAQGYGSPERTVAYGGSAGGMLMGAVANMRPDLWAGIIGAVPFVDVLNTMSDASLPLTPPEWPEWGNPLEDPKAYDTIAAYSPYDNIEAKPYPAILATGGLSDPRVTYWEPEKWVAKLREHTTGAAPILLKINMEAGHGGASGRFDFLKEIALDYAFAIWAVEKGWEACA
ncbi:MAG: S9 family peptidase [Alphaproteobacteria bacterium]